MKVIYTAIFGEGYELRQPAHAAEGWTYVCVTDREDIKDGGVYRISRTPRAEYPKLASRQMKIVSGMMFMNLFQGVLPEVSVYHDSRFVAPADPEQFVAGLPSVDVVVMEHNKRKTIEQEAQHVIEKGIDTREAVQETLDRLFLLGFDTKSVKLGLYAPGVMVRRYTSAAVGAFEMAWFKLVSHGSARDQLTLPAVLCKSGVRFATVPFKQTYDLWMGR